MKNTFLLILTTLALLLGACGPKEDPIDPTPANVPVASVSLNQQTMTLDVGATGVLTSTVMPSNATDKNVTWSSSNTSVVTVANGTVTAVAEGTATITATASGKTATCSVTVNKRIVPVSKVTLNAATAEIHPKDSLQLEATVEPADATDKTLKWTSDNEEVASVDETGLVKAVAIGKAKITVSAGDKQASCEVSVVAKNVESVQIEPAEITINQLDTLKLGFTVKPEDASVTYVHWTLDEGNILSPIEEEDGTVRDDGSFVAVGYGTTTVQVVVNNVKATCKVTVIQTVFEVESVKLDLTEATLEPDQTQTLSATVKPDNATDPSVEWVSDNTNVATVDANGLVTAVDLGVATITAKAGEQTATCKITVVEPEYVAKEKAALKAFYLANNGDNWRPSLKERWFSDLPLWQWTGIEMTEDRKHVKTIWINDPNARGFIPKEIADLTELETLRIYYSGNDETGVAPLPNEIGALKKLKIIDLQEYPLTGKLPESLFGLKNLEELRISYARSMDTWTIPKAIAKLTNLKTLGLIYCNLEGQIPPEIGDLTGLENLNLSGNSLTGTIPTSFGSLRNLKVCDLSINKLKGPIPASLSNIVNYWDVWTEMFLMNNFTAQDLVNAKIPSPKSPMITDINGETFDIDEEISKNRYTVIFSAEPESGDAVEFTNQLASLYKAKKNSGLGVIMQYTNSASEDSEVKANDDSFKNMMKKTGAGWKSFIRYMYKKYSDGTSPYYSKWGSAMYPGAIMNAIVIIGPDKTVAHTNLLDGGRKTLPEAMKFLEGVFKYSPNNYESKSYSQDGKVTKFQTASVGKGIDLVITGDAFSDRQITDGTFKKAATQAVADLFSTEPYKSMKNRFNVYFVNAVSKHEEYFNGCSTAFEGAFGNGSAVGGNNAKVLEYARKAVGISRMDNVAVLVLMNSYREGGTCYMMEPENKSIYAGGASVSWVPYKDVSVNGGVSSLFSTIVHELGGHGIAKLDDEYAYRDQGRISQGRISYIEEVQRLNWYMNVSVTSDPSKVPWSQFIGDSAYASENIGVYEGGDTFWFGVWRPTEQSIMNNNHSHFNFNAPSRSQIYTRIMKLSDGETWKYDYNAFKTWDKAHPAKVTTRSIVEVDNTETPAHVPPVHVRKTWKEVIDGR